MTNGAGGHTGPSGGQQVPSGADPTAPPGVNPNLPLGGNQTLNPATGAVGNHTGGNSLPAQVAVGNQNSGQNLNPQSPPPNWAAEMQAMQAMQDHDDCLQSTYVKRGSR